MKKAIVLTVVVSIFFLWGPLAQAKAGFKIGVVDFQRVLSTSSPGKLASADLNKKGREMEDALKKQEEELLELKKTLEREALVMGKDKSEEKQREFRIKANDYKTMKSDYGKEFKQIQARFFNKIKTDVLGLAAEMGKQQGFDLILEVNEAGVMYHTDAIDITDELIGEYNKKAATE